MTFDLIVSTCSRKDSSTWFSASRLAIKYLHFRKYNLIVPSKDVDFFKDITPQGITVVDEAKYLSIFKPYLESRINQTAYCTNRLGWYTQQLLKLLSLSELEDHQIGLIWDADTIPLRPLFFKSKKEQILYYQSNESHEPYYKCIEKIVDLNPLTGKSFIAQCLPYKGVWMKALIDEIEARSKKDWIQAIIDSIDFSNFSGFSEYELLGLFASQRYPDQFVPLSRSWSRKGRLFDPLFLVSVQVNGIHPLAWLLSIKYDFITYEMSHSISKSLKLLARSSKAYVYNLFRRKSASKVDAFLASYFSDDSDKYVVQVGANDGIQNDPLRKYLKQGFNGRAILVEPLPSYAKKLNLLYHNHNQISVIQCAISSRPGVAKLYYIDPLVADEMDGNGPYNHWAHGQGSFDINTVKYWIYKNKFRGHNYRKNIQRFISSILDKEVPLMRLDEIVSPHPNMLLCIDVQGAEYEVIKSLGNHIKPKYIIVEDDLQNGAKVRSLLSGLDYVCLGGKTDKIYQLNEA